MPERSMLILGRASNTAVFVLVKVVLSVRGARVYVYSTDAPALGVKLATCRARERFPAEGAAEIHLHGSTR